MNPAEIEIKGGKKICVRNAVEEDVDGIRDLERATGISSWPRSDYVKLISKDTTTLVVAPEERCLLGFAATRLITVGTSSIEEEAAGRPSTSRDSAEIEILNLAVDPEFRRLGIGKQIIGRIVETFNEFESLSIYLEVRKSNYGAIEFYRSNKRIG